MAAPGGSNDRSIRVLLDYLENNKTDDLVVIFAITELSRVEFPKLQQDLSYEIYKIGSWQTDPNINPDVNHQKFVTQYYTEYYSQDFQKKLLAQRLTMLDSFLTQLNIPHYFINMLCRSEDLSDVPESLPLLEFNAGDYNGNVIDCLKELNFKPDNHNHYDHDASEYIAQHIYDKILMKHLSDKLLSSKGFCVLPFLHSCVFPNGEAKPCCINNGYSYGNINDSLYSDIFSNKNNRLIEFRQQFLNSDTLPNSCQTCKTEYGNQDSYRDNMNLFLKKELKKFKTEEELLNNEKYHSFDIRFSNLCNMRCHYCGPQESSRVAEEWTTLHDWPKDQILLKNISLDNYDDFFKFFKNNIPHIRKIYSCGGEPILLKEHYAILDLLLDHKVENQIELVYNSNLTHLSLGNKNILDYWNKFPKVIINASIDAGWEQFEYIRDGGKWEDVYTNIKKIVYEAPHVTLQLSPVITFWNIFHFPKVYKFLVEENLIKRNNLQIQPVNDIHWMHPGILPQEIKDQAVAYYKNEYSDYRELEHLLNTMLARDSAHLLNETKSRVTGIDKHRNKDFYKTFPEYKDLFKGIT